MVYEEVKRAINLFKKNHAYEQDKLEGDLQEVSRVVKTYVEYKKVNVLVFMNKSEDIEFQVYDGTTRNDDYSIAFQKQYNNNTQRRDIDIINKLWEDNFEDPANVIRQTENITGSNMDYKFQVYSLPNKPIRLTDEFVNSINMEQKMNIIAGLCRGIESIHKYDTPLYHRNINPDAFYIFDIRGKYKPLLAKFDCTKDSADAAFTVFQNVEKKVRNQNTNQFFAPEVLKANMGIGVDWEKADIYSLAKLILFILTGHIIEDTDYIDEINGLDDELKLVLMEMLDDEPQNRPEISNLLNSL